VRTNAERKLKASGKSVEECAEADWGKGTFNGDGFVKVVYLTLRAEGLARAR